MADAAKLCAGCQARPRRYACLRCGDALCRRCTARNACGCWVLAPTASGRASTAADLADHIEQLAENIVSPVAAALILTSSAVPPPASRAAETPSASTTPLLPEDAGGGRASTSQPSSDRAVLRAAVASKRLVMRPAPASQVTTAASSVALHARARGPVAGQHARPADFFADKPALPPARPPVVPERGARHAR